jgi:hypothetical protein
MWTDRVSVANMHVSWFIIFLYYWWLVTPYKHITSEYVDVPVDTYKCSARLNSTKSVSPVCLRMLRDICAIWTRTCIKSPPKRDNGILSNINDQRIHNIHILANDLYRKWWQKRKERQETMGPFPFKFFIFNSRWKVENVIEICV